MEIIRKRIYARAGLLGNPSDGYHGKTISISVRDFWAEVVLYEWGRIEILPAEQDYVHFASIEDLARDVELHGYYGGIRLIKATIKRFVDYCRSQNIWLHERNFSIRYRSSIPRQVGLAGSSALVIAALRCLMEFYGVEIPLEIQPTLALSVEQDELGIAGGLQDRVIECYEGLVYMNFDPAQARQVHGITVYHYERLEVPLPPLYLAYHVALSEPTEKFHNDVRGRYDHGEPLVVNAMRHFARLAAEGREALLNSDQVRLAELINENFDTRRSIYQLPAWQIQMVETARACGASAKFAGSGGAIIGTYQDEQMLNHLKHVLGKIGSRVILPQILP